MLKGFGEKTYASESKWQRGWSRICHGHAPLSVRNLCIKLQLVRFPSECKVDVQNIIENMISLCNFRLFCILVIPVYTVWLIPACHFTKKSFKGFIWVWGHSQVHSEDITLDRAIGAVCGLPGRSFIGSSEKSITSASCLSQSWIYKISILGINVCTLQTTNLFDIDTISHNLRSTCLGLCVLQV